MKQRHVVLLIVFCLCLLMLAIPASTQIRPAAALQQAAPLAAPPPPRPAPDISPLRMIVRFFNFTPEQTELLKSHFESQRQAIEPLRIQIAEKEEALRNALTSNPDPGTVGVLVIEIHGLRGQINEIHKQLIPGFENILDEDQMGKLRALRNAARLQPVVEAMRQVNLLMVPPPPQ